VTVETADTRSRDAYAGYAEPSERPPFGPYAGLAALFNVLTGIATHKLSRLIAKDKITAFARAPFTEFKEPGGPAEVEERARGGGWKRTLGELLVCPYCLGMWISGGFNLGLIVAPRGTRFVASVLTGLTISDFLQIAYKAAEDRGLGGS
jgi:hypothetical protein